MCLLFRYIFTLNNKLINSMFNWMPKYNLIGGHVKPLVPRSSDREGAGPSGCFACLFSDYSLTILP